MTSIPTDGHETPDCSGCLEREARLAEFEQHEEMLSDQLLKVSRMASKAETYVGLLHNIGNILNSVSVSAKIIIEKARVPRHHKVKKAIGLIKENLDDIANYLHEDKNGSRVIEYIDRLLDSLEEEDVSTLANMTTLDQGVGHITEIIQAQQANADGASVDVEISPAEVIDAALLICSSNFADSGVEIVRECEVSRSILSDRHKILQILVNLIRNAQQALAAHPVSDPRITLRSQIDSDDNLVIEISDNGPGIGQDALAKLFSFGFTTKSDGHGYGLHSSANNASALGGQLSASSEGPGRGATFTLTLPTTTRPSK